MSGCAEVQSARPIANAVEFPAPVSTRTKPIIGESLLWVWIDNLGPSKGFVIPLGTGARPFAPLRYISDDPTDSSNWVTYEHPWVTEQVSAFISGEIQWPEDEVEY